MSTRSGKRIHRSLHENAMKTDIELAPKSERKTRSKLMKENIEDPNIVLQKFQKRENYVSYPTDDEQVGDTANTVEVEGKHTRTLRKNALKELNPSVLPTESSEVEEPPKTSRTTRRTRKFAEFAAEGAENGQVQDIQAEVVETKSKKSRRKKTSSEGAETQQKTKKKNKRKKGKRSNSFVTENVVEELIVDNKIDIINKSNISNDSFHSAAGSPIHEEAKPPPIQETEVISSEIFQPRKSNRKAKQTQVKHNSEEHLVSEVQDSSVNKNNTFEIDKLKRNSGVHLSINESDDVNKGETNGNISLSEDEDGAHNKNGTFDIEPSSKTSSIINTDHNESVTKGKNTSVSNDECNKNNTFDVEQKSSNKRRSSIKNSTFDSSVTKTRKSDVNISLNKDNEKKNDTFDLEPKDKNESVTKIINTTYEKEDVVSASKSRKRKSTVDIDMNMITSPVDLQTDKKPSLNSTYDKETSVKGNSTFEIDNTNSPRIKKVSVNTTFEKESESPQAKLRKSGNMISDRKSRESLKINLTQSLNSTSESTKITEKLNNTFDKPEKGNSTFNKDLNRTFDKLSKSPNSDNSQDLSRISITSDESMTEQKSVSTEKPLTIMNVTPVLIDSSIDSLISEESKTETPLKREGTFSLEEIQPEPLLKREGTFTKDGPDDPISDLSPATPRKNASLPSPGCTPFPNKSSTKKPLLNVTRSIEKRTSIVERPPRATKVMFCSPVNNPVVVAQQKRMVIKSNLKGSNKSFVYEEIVDTPPLRPAGRKRSFTHCEADDGQVKRKRLTEDLRQSADRLSRPRTSSANAKLTDSTPTKKTPTKAKLPRTKLPNFAAMHQKQFEKMESLDECQERKAKRARQLLTPVPGVNLPEKSSPKVTDSPKELPKKEKKSEILTKSFSQEAAKPAYTRFGFKLNLDVNPFSITKNPVKKDNGLKRQATLPSLTGATSVRREVAKQVVMREKSFSDKRLLKRNENRTIIKGVRTNRRFELQMKLRNIE